ncbi:hypothetical protein ABTQ08_22340, partial [Acinetobacter baumannii]
RCSDGDHRRVGFGSTNADAISASVGHSGREGWALRDTQLLDSSLARRAGQAFGWPAALVGRALPLC